MKTKEDLEKEYELLSSHSQTIKIPIKIELPNGIKIEKDLKVDVDLYWDQGTEGSVWIFDKENGKDANCLDLDQIAEEINKQYNVLIEKFCDDSEEFEKNGGEPSWW